MLTEKQKVLVEIFQKLEIEDREHSLIKWLKEQSTQPTVQEVMKKVEEIIES